MQFKYKNFEDSFRQMLKDAESRTDVSKHLAHASSSVKVMTVTVDTYAVYPFGRR